MNLLSFSVTSIFNVIKAEKQLIKQDVLTHCLTCNFRHMSQYNSFPSVWRGLTEHRREHPVYRFGSKLYRQIVYIPMGTNCAPLVANLFLFCYERDFMTSLSADNQADIIEAFNSTSRYLDNLLNIDNLYFERMVNLIQSHVLQLNKNNTSDTEAPFLDFHLSISNGFDIVNFPFLDCDVPRRPSYGIYISQLIRLARV